MRILHGQVVAVVPRAASGQVSRLACRDRQQRIFAFIPQLGAMTAELTPAMEAFMAKKWDVSLPDRYG
jgi:hypothetical protein